MDIDDLSPSYLRESRLSLTLSDGSKTQAFSPVLIDVDYSATAPEYASLPLVLEVHGPSQQSYQRQEFFHAKPIQLAFTPREGGEHRAILREAGHNYWWGSLAVSVVGDRLSQVASANQDIAAIPPWDPPSDIPAPPSYYAAITAPDAGTSYALGSNIPLSGTWTSGSTVSSAQLYVDGVATGTLGGFTFTDSTWSYSLATSQIGPTSIYLRAVHADGGVAVSPSRGFTVYGHSAAIVTPIDGTDFPSGPAIQFSGTLDGGALVTGAQIFVNGVGEGALGDFGITSNSWSYSLYTAIIGDFDVFLQLTYSSGEVVNSNLITLTSYNRTAEILLPVSGTDLTVGAPVTFSGTVVDGLQATSAFLRVGSSDVKTFSDFTITNSTWSVSWTPSSGDAGTPLISVRFGFPGYPDVASLALSYVVTGVDASIPTSYPGYEGWWTPQTPVTESAYRSNALATVAQYAAANCAVTANQPDHLGGNSGFLLTETGTGSIQHYIRTTGTGDTGIFYSGDVSVNYYAKPNVGTRGVCQYLNISTGGVTANLSTKAITVGAVTADSAATDAGNGWTRFSSVISNTSITNNHIGLSGNLTSMAAYTAGEVGSVYVSLGPEGHCSQTRVLQCADRTGLGRHAVRGAGSETLQPLLWTSPSGLGKFFGSSGNVAKSLACPSAVATALRGSFTIGMRLNITTVAAGTVVILAPSTTTPDLRLSRTASTLVLKRTLDNGTTLSATIATGLTVGVHTVFFSYDSSDGTAVCYLNKGAGVTGTVTVGSCTIDSMIIGFQYLGASEISIHSAVLTKAQCDALADGFNARKGLS